MKKFLVLLISSFVLLSYNIYPTPSDNLLINRDSSKINKNRVHILLELTNKNLNQDFKTKWTYANKALRLSEQLNYKQGIAESKLSLGYLALNAGILMECLDLLQDALFYFKETNDYKHIAITTSYIASYYSILNKHKKALEYHKDYYLLSKKYGFLKNKVNALAKIGYVYLQFNHDSAIIYLTKALKLSKENNYPVIYYQTLANLTDLNYSIGQYKKSINYGLEYIKSPIVKNNGKKCVNYSLAQSYYKLGDIEKSKFYLKKAESIEIDTLDFKNVGNVYEMRFLAYRDMNNYKLALENYEKYTSFLIETNNKKNDKELANFQVLYDTKKKESQIESLSKQNKIISLESKQRKQLLYILLLIVLSLLIIFFLIIRLLVIKRNTNKKLFSANFELKEQKEELLTMNEEISSQREDLYDKNIALEKTLDQLKETQTKLIHADKMASIGTLSAGIAHEINNPLNFIVGGISIIDIHKNNASFQNSKEMLDALEMINEGAKRSTNIVKALMSYTSKSESGSTLTDVNNILDYSLTILNNEINDIRIEKNYTEFFKLDCYRDKLLQVFISVLKNSIFALNRNELGKQKIIRIVTRYTEGNNQKYGLIIISNTGPQIPENIIRQIFDPFFTTKDPDKGTGLGLTTSYNIIKEHNGSIVMQNTAKGVECKIKIPYVG